MQPGTKILTDQLCCLFREPGAFLRRYSPSSSLSYVWVQNARRLTPRPPLPRHQPATQALIDNGSYITGPYAPFANGSFLGLVEPTGTNKIYGYQSLNGPADSARGNKLSLQLITTFNLAPDWKVVNYQFYEHLRSQKSELYGYDEWVPGVSLYDTRTELSSDQLGIRTDG